MKKKIVFLVGFVLFVVISFVGMQQYLASRDQPIIEQPKLYWFLLDRGNNREYFYQGVPGEKEKSTLLKTFVVKTGIPGERPTPLPQLVGRKYWLLIKKEPTENPETAPYFLTLDVPAPTEAPFGPEPYQECNGEQCNWELPGEFGLHGVNGDESRLSESNPGSSGCIRHTDEDITYLYNLLDPAQQEIRYYIKS